MNRSVLIIAGLIVIFALGAIATLLWNYSIASTFGLPEFSILKGVAAVLFVRLMAYFMREK